MYKEALNQYGWVEIEGISDDQTLMEVAEGFGNILPGPRGELLSVLRPSLPHKASSKSFSFNKGLGEFPLHTDTAFWKFPARYVVLRSNCASTTNTTIFSADKVESVVSSELARRAIFSIRTTMSNHYSTIRLDDILNGVRYDPCYMNPVNAHAQELSKSLSLIESSQLDHIVWTGINAIVIDNWRCLHGRGAVTSADTGRKLSRIYIKGD